MTEAMCKLVKKTLGKFTIYHKELTSMTGVKVICIKTTDTLPSNFLFQVKQFAAISNNFLLLMTL